ncbi:MAG: DUF1778 domain-containing protein [Planctomycetes bacterium]|nr:DUF1778 domain-containing protein [Planctomycetota bacterium]
MRTRRANNKKNRSPIATSVPAHVQTKLEQAAAWRGTTVSSFVIEAALREAEQVIERERLIRLTAEDAARLVSLLDGPPAPNAALRKAAADHQRIICG